MFSSVMKKFGGNKDKAKEYSKSKSRSMGGNPRTPRVGTQEDLEPLSIDSTVAAEKFNAAKLKTVSVSSNVDVEAEVATVFSEGEDEVAISILKDHIDNAKEESSNKLWYMLMDIYQIKGDSEAFNQLALEYAQVYNTSPPSWFGDDYKAEKEMAGGGKNMLILEPILKDTHIEKFREFLKSAKEEKFCRINVSQCKFEQNDIKHIEKILKLFTDLRRVKITAILMGDNNLIKFCKSYVELGDDEKTLKPELVKHEQLLWLLYLEVLQWKGQQEEFEEYALKYAEKFEISPPGWEDDGVMSFKQDSKELTAEDAEVEFDRNLNSNNIDKLLNYINEKFELGEDAIINFNSIDRLDFGAAGAVSFHIQELSSNTQYASRKVVFKHPNELIVALLDMVGCVEFIEVIERQRK